jgi:hypothetical protein
MKQSREFFGEVLLDGRPLAAYKRGAATIQDRYLLKDILEYIHIKKGLLAPYGPSYPLIDHRELLPSFEKNFAEYHELPSFSMVAFNRALSYQQEMFQFDLLHSWAEDKRRYARETLDKIIPHLDREFRPAFKQQFTNHDLTDLAYYEELLDYLFHMDRAHVIARDAQNAFRLLGVYASFPSELDTELKSLGRKLGKFKKLDNATYERERVFVYQFLMELYGFPIAAERRTSAALFARKLSRLKEQYLVKVLGASDRTITSMSGFEQKKYPLVEKIALIALPPGLAEAHPQYRDQGFFVDPERRVVILKITYQQHKYNPLNVLEDRAQSVLKQELIHPYTGRRDVSLNLLKDPRRSLAELTDIVRGEYLGSIAYRRSDLVTSTKTHEERLKFLSAWLAKNRRRLGTASPETFEAAKKVLNSYLLNREYREAFMKYPELHREVLQQLAYLTQAQQLQLLERLVQAKRGLGSLGPVPRLTRALDFLEGKKNDLPYFYPDLFEKCLNLWDQLLNYPYFRKLAALLEPPEKDYPRQVWELLARGQELLAFLRERHSRVEAEARQGTPFPVVAPETRRTPPPAQSVAVPPGEPPGGGRSS